MKLCKLLKINEIHTIYNLREDTLGDKFHEIYFHDSRLEDKVDEIYFCVVVFTFTLGSVNEWAKFIRLHHRCHIQLVHWDMLFGGRKCYLQLVGPEFRC